MKIFQKILIATLLLTLLSCKNNSDSDGYLDPEKLFHSKRKTLIGEVLREPVWNDSFWSRLFHTQYGIITVSDINGQFIQLLDPETAEVLAYGGTRGRGPFEVINAGGWHYDYQTSTMYLGDAQLRKVVLFRIGPDSIEPYEEIKVPRAYARAMRVDDSIFVGVNFAPNQAVGLFNLDGEYLVEHLYRPVELEGMNFKNRYFTVSASLSPNRKYYAVSCSVFFNIRLYSISDRNMDLVWEKISFPPPNNTRDNWIIYSKDTRVGSTNSCNTDNYIYILAENQNAEQHNKSADNGTRKYKLKNLLVYDYSGELVGNVILDHFICGIAVSDDDKYLYGLTEIEDEFYIVRYDLEKM